MKLKSILGAFVCALFATAGPVTAAPPAPPDSPPPPALVVEKLFAFVPLPSVTCAIFAQDTKCSVIALSDYAILNAPARLHISDARQWRLFEQRTSGTGLTVDIRQLTTAPPGKG